jgi:hypothetical protein
MTIQYGVCERGGALPSLCLAHAIQLSLAERRWFWPEAEVLYFNSLSLSLSLSIYLALDPALALALYDPFRSRSPALALQLSLTCARSLSRSLSLSMISLSSLSPPQTPLPHNLRAAGCGQIVVRERHDKSERAEDPSLFNIRVTSGQAHGVRSQCQKRPNTVLKETQIQCPWRPKPTISASASTCA